jgi:hypothetical protein
MKILLLFPILVYLLLVLVNIDFIYDTEVINIFGIKKIEIPFIFYNSAFVVIYSVLILFIYDWLDIFLRHKIKKQEREIVELKAKLYDWQSDVLKKISKENKENIKSVQDKSDEKIIKYIKKSDEQLEEYKKSNKELLLQHWKETDKLLGKINLIDKGVLDKIKNSLK